jgi:hypothetical protein
MDGIAKSAQIARFLIEETFDEDARGHFLGVGFDRQLKRG